MEAAAGDQDKVQHSSEEASKMQTLNNKKSMPSLIQSASTPKARRPSHDQGGQHGPRPRNDETTQFSLTYIMVLMMSVGFWGFRNVIRYLTYGCSAWGMLSPSNGNLESVS